MKNLVSAGCLLLHLTTFVSASPPPDDLDDVSQYLNILTDDLFIEFDTNNRPPPSTLPFPSDGQAHLTTFVSASPSPSPEGLTSVLQSSNIVTDVLIDTSNQPPPYTLPSDERYLKKKQKQRERYHRLKDSKDPEDQKACSRRKAYLTLRCRIRTAEKKKKLAALSTQKYTQVNSGNLVFTSDVHVPSLTEHIISFSSGPTQESQIQYDKKRYASERAEWNAGAVCTDSNNLGRETGLDRRRKRRKVNSDSLEPSPVTDDTTYIGQSSNACPVNNMQDAIETHNNAKVRQFLDTYNLDTYNGPPIDFEPLLEAAVYKGNVAFLREILHNFHLSSDFTCTLARKAAESMRDLEALKIIDNFLDFRKKFDNIWGRETKE